VIANFPNRLFQIILRRLVVFPLGRPYVVPSDKLGHEVASLLISPSATRDRLTADTYLPDNIEDPVGALEAALEAMIAAEPIEARLRLAQKEGRFTPGLMTSGDVDEVWRCALDAKIITQEDFDIVQRRNMLRDKVIRVNDFPYDFGLRAALVDLDKSDSRPMRAAA
jgi:acyl-CoA dehydrogenase